MKIYKNYVVLIFILITACQSESIHISNTTCNLDQNPPVVNTLQPKFGWELTSKKQNRKQSAYQVIVSSNIDDIQLSDGDMWFSGKVLSDQSQSVEYGGKPLISGKRYYWKVRIWNLNDQPSEWSEIKVLDIGLEQKDWKAKWIGAIRNEDCNLPEGHNWPKYSISKKLWPLWTDSVAEQAKRSIQLRKEFNIKKEIKIAKVYISGLGHYELTVNGNKIGDYEFAPLWSNYDKTVYYNLFEVTDNLKTGVNAIGLLLGNGMYNVTGNRYAKFWGSYGPPTLKLQLEIKYTDGTSDFIVSDESWKYINSPITFNCIYGGEDYDARLEIKDWNQPGFDDSEWHPVILQDGPKGELVAQTAPPVKIMEEYPVKKIIYAAPGKCILDMGQNLSGFPIFKVKGKRGQTIRFKVGEQLVNDTMVSQKQTGGKYYYDYTLKGGGIEEWHPRFSYYGFQYIQVEGANYKSKSPVDTLPELVDIKSCFIRSSAEETGHFECSNDLYTKVEWLINNSIKSNMQAMFTDCPHREKLGWLEQTHLMGPGLFYTFDVALIYRKYQRDMADSQTEDGLVPNIAPEYLNFGGVFRDTPEWGSSFIINPWIYYEFTGDDELLKAYYPSMKRYFQYLLNQSDSMILKGGLGDWYDFGKERSGFPQNTPISLPATAYFYYDAVMMANTAEYLNDSEDVKYYRGISEQIKQAYNDKYFNQEINQYSTGSQAANAMSLYMGLVDSVNRNAVLKNLIANIRDNDNRFTTGDIATEYLFQVLAENGYNDVMYDLTSHNKVPGYGYQLKYGLTTLAENWDPGQGASRNHFMMGHIKEWFYKDLAGINADLTHPGFKHIIFKPELVGDSSWVKCSCKSLYGNIVSNWKLEDDIFTYEIEIPVNCTATVILQNSDLASTTVNGKYLKETTTYDGFDLGSGKYLIISKLKQKL